MATQLSGAQHLERTRDLLEKLTGEVERNTEILRRSQQRELKLLQSEDLGALFRTILVSLARSYRLDAMTVVMCDPDHEVRQLLVASGSAVQEFPGLSFVDSLAGLAPQYAALELPWLGPYSRDDHGQIMSQHRALRSVALIPFRRNGKLFGSMNFGSRDASRFTARHATDFLAHLGAIASFALENAVNQARLTRSGFTDVLTGWHNRRSLEIRIAEELARARRQNSPLSCLMLDIDHFKKANDQYGHQAGDQILRELTRRVDAKVRATDVTARYGGEEFTILLPDTDVDSAALLAERVRSAVASTPFDLGDGQHLKVTVSIGIAGASPERLAIDLATYAQSLIARADDALYRAKSEGRDRVALSSDDE